MRMPEATLASIRGNTVESKSGLWTLRRGEMNVRIAHMARNIIGLTSRVFIIDAE